jgi:hypothetical protein
MAPRKKLPGWDSSARFPAMASELMPILGAFCVTDVPDSLPGLFSSYGKIIQAWTSLGVFSHTVRYPFRGTISVTSNEQQRISGEKQHIIQISIEWRPIRKMNQRRLAANSGARPKRIGALSYRHTFPKSVLLRQMCILMWADRISSTRGRAEPFDETHGYILLELLLFALIYLVLVCFVLLGTVCLASLA